MVEGRVLRVYYALRRMPEGWMFFALSDITVPL
jgi:hypothetical protein